MFALSQRSLDRLKGVHPDLVRVVKRAIKITPLDFGIAEGKRDLETQKRYVAEGKSQTMDSKHLAQRDGFSHAVDLYVLVANKSTSEYEYFRKVIQAMFTAAIEEDVQIEAGGLWRDFIDSPHFQLNSKYYPV